MLVSINSDVYNFAVFLSILHILTFKYLVTWHRYGCTAVFVIMLVISPVLYIPRLREGGGSGKPT